MKLYEIDSQYMEYLYKADSKVLIHNSGNHQRKFIAIKVLINGYKYFVPYLHLIKEIIIMIKMVIKKFNLHEFQLLKEYLMEIQRLNHI